MRAPSASMTDEASRILALSLYQQFPDLDGLADRSRYDNGQICSIACGNRTYQLPTRWRSTPFHRKSIGS